MTQNSNFEILDMFGGISPETKISKMFPDIVSFAESNEFCGKTLYPRQKTFLRMCFLEKENFTDFDRATIDTWIKQGKMFDSGADVFLPDDVYFRIDKNIENGRKHFKEIIEAGGRRGGKGYFGGTMGAYKTYYLVNLDDPQDYYGLDRDKDLYLNVVATSTTQAKKYLFADIAMTVLGCKALQPYILKAQEEEIRIQTPSDRRKRAELKKSGVKVAKDLASVRITANASSSKSGRGGAAFMQAFDEFAHALDTGSTMSATEVYEAYTPSLAQLGKDGLIYVPSSPWTSTGKFYELCCDAKEVNENNEPKYPEMLVIQHPSWAQPLDSKILTPSGWTTMGEVKEGDFVYGSNGKPTRITKIYERGMLETYRITTKNGEQVEASADHLWEINKNESYGKSENTVVSTTELKSLVDSGEYRVTLPKLTPIEYPEKQLALSPYVLGCMLGDGYIPNNVSGGNSHCTLGDAYDENINEFVSEMKKSFGDVFYTYKNDNSWHIRFDKKPQKEDTYSCLCCGENKVILSRGLCKQCYHRHSYKKTLDSFPKNWWKKSDLLVDSLAELGLLGKRSHDKFIPQEYMTASVEDRIALIQGLLDTDGHITKDSREIYLTTVSEQLRDDFIEVCQSLGFITWYRTRDARGKGKRETYTVCVKSPNEVGSLFRNKRKTARWEQRLTRKKNYFKCEKKIVSVEKIESKVCRCISVESEDNLYVTDNFILTHNCMYQGFETDPRFKRAIISYDDNLKQKEMRDPEKFNVEYRARFAKTIDAYLAQEMVDRVFDNDLVLKQSGDFGVTYRFHADPAKSQDTFCVAGGHAEKREDGYLHVVFDFMRAYQAKDFPPDPVTKIPWVDYNYVNQDILKMSQLFNIGKFTFDQFNCLDKDTLIPTSDGLLTIEEMVGELPVGCVKDVKSLVQTKDGVQSTQQACHKGDKKTIKFTTKHGVDLYCTPEHRLWVSKDRSGDFEWLRADEIAEGMYFQLQLGSVGADNELNIEKYHPQNIKGELPKTLNEELAKALGLFVSGGFEKGNDSLAQLFKNMGIHSRDVVPFIIRKSPQRIQAAFLASLFGGNSTGDLYHTTSERLATEVQQMLHSMGILTTKWENEERKQWQVKVLGRSENSYFDKITSISDGGTRDCYDISVPTVENFIGNGVVCHNSVQPIQHLRQCIREGKTLNRGQIVEEFTFTKSGNKDMFDVFKSAIYMGLVHAPKYVIDYGGAGIINYPAEEMKFLQEINGRVDHQKCLPADTLIMTTNGAKRIIDLDSVTDMVYAISEDRKEIATVPFEGAIETMKTSVLFRIETDGGHIIECTENHPILTESGYKEANVLCNSDSVMCYNSNIVLSKIKSISKIELEEEIPVYDIAVPNYNNFVLANGAIVHNSGNIHSKDMVDSMASVVYDLLADQMRAIEENTFSVSGGAQGGYNVSSTREFSGVHRLGAIGTNRNRYSSNAARGSRR